MTAGNFDSSRVDRIPPIKSVQPRTFRPAKLPNNKKSPLGRPVIQRRRQVVSGTRSPVVMQPCENFAEIRVPRDLLASLQAILGLQAFVETGTSGGTTTRQMSYKFREVHTIELFQPTFEKAVKTLADRTNIRCWQGDSAEVLPKVLAEIKHPTAFWLDGHYSGPGTGLGSIECPLVAELAALKKFPHTAVIMIDDARFLFGNPPAPHDPKQWPHLRDLMPAADCDGSFYWILFEDVVIKFPATTLTIAWFEAWRRSEFGRTAHVLIQGTRRPSRGTNTAGQSTDRHQGRVATGAQRQPDPPQPPADR